MFAKPQAEHHWLDRLIGDWTFENECMMGPDQPPMKHEGTESVRSIGGLWTVGEGTGPEHEGEPMRSIMTLGYDPARGKYIGTFIASMMTYLWEYEGALDEAGRLVLDAEGPAMDGSGKMRKYQDIIEFISDDHRTLSSQILGDDGNWTRFMTAHYRRK